MLNKFDAGNVKCGIYAIYIDDIIVYVGKSINLPYRVHEHEMGIKSGKGTASWYYIANQFYIRNFTFSMKVLEEADEEDILEKEEEYIRKYRPIFNERINFKEKKSVPRNYIETSQLLGLELRKPINLQQIENEERALKSGWFGEYYINKDEFYWWEYEQIYGNYKQSNNRRK